MKRAAIPTVYELSVPGRQGVDLPVSDVPPAPIPQAQAQVIAVCPNSQIGVVRHYVALSGSFGVDSASIRSALAPGNTIQGQRRGRSASGLCQNSHPLQSLKQFKGSGADVRPAEWLAEIGGFAGVCCSPLRITWRIHRTVDDARLPPCTRRHQAPRILIGFCPRHKSGLDHHGRVHRDRIAVGCAATSISGGAHGLR